MSIDFNADNASRSVLELKVHNHPGVMSRVCGLFARRAYNVEGIICVPMGERRYSCIWLLVSEDTRLEQVIQQTRKLHDVLEVQRHGVDHEVFRQLEVEFS